MSCINRVSELLQSMLLMWVRAFRKEILEISVNTNQGVERKNKDFKYQISLQIQRQIARWYGYCASGIIFDEKMREVRYSVVNLALR